MRASIAIAVKDVGCLLSRIRDKRHPTSAVLSATVWIAALVIHAQGPATGAAGKAHDPGVRASGVSAGQPLAALSADQFEYFQDGRSRFLEVDSVLGDIEGAPGRGLGPLFNATSCATCHSQPSAGGSSPNANQYPYVGGNPQIQAASDAGGR